MTTNSSIHYFFNKDIIELSRLNDWPNAEFAGKIFDSPEKESLLPFDCFVF